MAQIARATVENVPGSSGATLPVRCTDPQNPFLVTDCNCLKDLDADRTFAVDSPAPYWIWPFKHNMSKYQLYKGRVYLRKGIATLEGAMKKSPDFRAGLGPRLQKVNEQYVLHSQSTGQVLADLCSRPELLAIY